MSAPTTYTYEEFADYLKLEVLRDSAEWLGWGDLVSPAPRRFYETTVTSNTGSFGTPVRSTIVIPRTEAYIRQGTVLTFSGGLTRTAYANYPEATTSIDVTPPLTLNQVQGQTMSFTVSEEIERVRNPNYDLVTDHVLSQMGLTNINQVNATNVYTFRLLGRLEILKRAFGNTAADYTYSAPGGNAQANVEKGIHLMAFYQYERERINRELVEMDYEPPTAKD